MPATNYLDVVLESRRLRNAPLRTPLPQQQRAAPAPWVFHLQDGAAGTASGAAGQPEAPGDPLALFSPGAEAASPIGEPGTPPSAPASFPGMVFGQPNTGQPPSNPPSNGQPQSARFKVHVHRHRHHLAGGSVVVQETITKSPADKPKPSPPADLSSVMPADFFTEVPAEPVTPPGSPPVTATGAPAYREVIQEILDAPPVEKHIGNVRGPQGYAWEKDTHVPMKYTPKDPSTPRPPLKPWEPPPIPQIGAELPVPAHTDKVGAGIPSGGGDIALHNFFSCAQEADVPYTKSLHKERVQLRGLRCIFSFERGKYVVSSLLRGGQLAQRARPGDRLVSVDGRNIDGLPPETVMRFVDGADGSQMKLEFMREKIGGFVMDVSRASSEMADIQAFTLQYLLSYLTRDNASEPNGVSAQEQTDNQPGQDSPHLTAAVAKVQEFLQELSEREELRIKESAEVLEKERADMRSSIDELKQQIKQCEQEKTELREHQHAEIDELKTDAQEKEKKLRAIIQTGDEKLEDQKKTYEMQLVAVRSEFASSTEQLAQEFEQHLASAVEQASTMCAELEDKLASKADDGSDVKQEAETKAPLDDGSDVEQEIKTTTPPNQDLPVADFLRAQFSKLTDFAETQLADQKRQFEDRSARLEEEYKLKLQEQEREIRAVISRSCAQTTARSENATDESDCAPERAGLNSTEGDPEETETMEKGNAKPAVPITEFLRNHFDTLRRHEEEKLAKQKALYEARMLQMTTDIQKNFEEQLQQQKEGYEKMMEREEHEMEEETIRLREELERSLADAAESATRAREEMEAEVVGATGAGAKGGTKDQSPIAAFLRGEFAKLKEAAIKDEQEKLAAQAAMYEKKLEQQKGEYEKMLEREEHEMEEVTVRLREELERSLADAAESATHAREEMEAEVVGATGAGAKGGTKDQSHIAAFLRGEFAKLKEAAIKDEQEKLAAQAAMYEKKLEQQKGEYEKRLAQSKQQEKILTDEIDYLHDNDMTGLSLLTSMDVRVLNDPEGRRTVLKKFTKQVEVVFGLGAHRLLGIGARGEHSCCVFDVVILPKAAYQKLGAQDQVHTAMHVSHAIHDRVEAGKAQGHRGMQLPDLDVDGSTVCLVGCHLRHAFDFLHTLQGLVIDLDSKITQKRVVQDDWHNSVAKITGLSRLARKPLNRDFCTP